SPRPGTRIGSAGPLNPPNSLRRSSADTLNTSATGVVGSGVGYLSIIGRDYKSLLLNDTDKIRVLNDMMQLKPIHTFAKLASPDGQRCTDVILAMKPVYLRARDQNPRGHTTPSSHYTN